MSKRPIQTEAVIPPAHLAHFVLRSRHFDEARAWYRTVLGAHPVFENDFICFMTYDEEHHRLGIINTAEAPEPTAGAAGLDHVAFTFGDLGELLGTYQRLRQAEIAPYWCINHGPTTSLYYRDPDGNQIELQVDNFPDAAALDAWFATGAFAKNPIGVAFDPEKLSERFEAGDPIEELLQQGSA